MFTFRVYVASLAVVFLLLSLQQGLGILAGMVITCTLIFLILDTKIDLDDLHKLETQLKDIT